MDEDEAHSAVERARVSLSSSGRTLESRFDDELATELIRRRDDDDKDG